MADLLQTAMLCMTALVITLVFVLNRPESPLRSFILEWMGWGTAAVSAVAIPSPLDLLPDIIPIAGWLDDIGYLLCAVFAFSFALRQRRERKQLTFGASEQEAKDVA